MVEKNQSRGQVLRNLLYIFFGIFSAIIICSLVGFLGLKLLIKKINEGPVISEDTDLRTQIAATLYSQYATQIPIVLFSPITKQIGPILNNDRGEIYSVEITLNDVQWNINDGIKESGEGNIYVFTHISIHNLGPNPIRSIGSYDFSVLDSNGILHENEYIFDDTGNCDLETVDIVMDGTYTGCMKFNVPKEGAHSLIYAPYQHNNLENGRYLSFPLKNTQ